MSESRLFRFGRMEIHQQAKLANLSAKKCQKWNFPVSRTRIPNTVNATANLFASYILTLVLLMQAWLDIQLAD